MITTGQARQYRDAIAYVLENLEPQIDLQLLQAIRDKQPKYTFQSRNESVARALMHHYQQCGWLLSIDSEERDRLGNETTWSVTFLIEDSLAK